MHSHVNTFEESVGGRLSKRGSDQVVEAAHQLLKSKMNKSGAKKLEQKVWEGNC